jgi:hypothetical protein
MLDKARSKFRNCCSSSYHRGQAEETDTRTVGSSARIDGQHSGSKSTGSEHSSVFCICSKRRAGCGFDHADLAPIPEQHISPSMSISDALQEHGPCCQTAARLNQLSELTNRVSCQSQSQPPGLAVLPSSLTRLSHSPVQVSCPSCLSESATSLTCPSQPSESHS